jgi:hypothetical protein
MPVSFQPLTSDSGFRSPGFLVDGSGNATVRSITVTTGGDDGGGGGSAVLTVDNIIVAGEKLIEDGDSSVSLGNGITGSYLTKVGVLQSLEIEGDLTVSEGSTPYLRVQNGSIVLNNFGPTPGSINNINIGDVTPATGAFTRIDIADGALLEVTFRGDFSLLVEYDFRDVVRYEDDLYLCIVPSAGNLPTDENYFEPYEGSNLLTVAGGITGTELTITGPGKIDATVIGTTSPARAVFTNVEIVDAPTQSNQATRKDYVDNRVSAFAIVFGA